jgi:radical SAM superfamily enzyme
MISKQVKQATSFVSVAATVQPWCHYFQSYKNGYLSVNEAKEIIEMLKISGS